MSNEDRDRHSRIARTRAEIFTWDHCIAQHVKAYKMASER